MRILVTGRRGQVSSALQALGPRHGFAIATLARPEFDLARPEQAVAALDHHRPDMLISAAAYTAVDRAESEPELAMQINGTAPGVLAQACAMREVPILHLSTDYVFDGLKTTPYREEDATGPTGVYGASKLAGEQAVAQATARHVILRTAWVYSVAGSNFINTMLGLMSKRDRVDVVADQAGCPTFAEDIAAALFAMARRIKASPDAAALYGQFHMAGGGDTTWAGLAQTVFFHAERAGHKVPRLVPITTAQYPTPARRPANSRLDCNKLKSVYGVSLPVWSDGLARCLATIFSQD